MSIAPPKPSPLTPGYRLDRYELLCPIAEGGMASVWVARLKGKHGFEKLVAIKTILPKYASDERFQQMFLDEARIASGIEHTNVAQIMDLGDEHDVLYLVMEWVDGDSVSKLMRAVEKKKSALPYGVVCRILADVCGGLHAAHELKGADGKLLGVVHRDVSPQNILVSTKGVAKLIDFGIAKAKDRLSGETSAGLLKGKVQYMAPEQALGQKVDARADIWAIGSILYHLFAGKPAYEGENQLATLHLLTSGKPPMPLPPKVPRPVVDVIRRAMNFNPEGRYETSAELQRALEKAMLDAHIATTTADVATYAQSFMAERADARKRAVDLALRAAAEREKMAEMLRAPMSGSGRMETPTPVGESPSSPGSRLAAISTPGSIPTGSIPSGVTQPYPAAQDMVPDIASVPSQASATLGTAGVMTPPPDVDIPMGVPSPAASRRRRVAVLVVAALGGCALVVLGLAVRRNGAGDSRAAASPRANVAAIVPGPAPTASPPPPVADVPVPSAAPLPSTSASVAAAASRPTVAAANKPPPPRPYVPPPKPPPKPSATATATAKPPVDDGF